MLPRLQDSIICIIILVATVLVYVVSQSIYALPSKNSDKSLIPSQLEDSWFLRLVINLLGYATIFVPGVLIVKYVRDSNYLDKTGGGCIAYIVRRCVTGDADLRLPLTDTVSPPASTPASRSTLEDAFLLFFCFMGLQVSYLTWGVLQEKVMTQEYVDSAGNVSHFKDSQFLVFVNRILAFALSGAYITLKRQPTHIAPLYKYSYCSFSNIMSSWCQYEALKYVSFPTQVLAKACKIIPVMLMGKLVSRKKYEYYEYVTAVLISLGMTFFLLGSADEHKGSKVTTISGVVLLCCYMIFDSFTSNWQGALFSQYKMSSVQMMCGVNLFSCLFTSVSLIQQGGFLESLNFMAQYPKFMFDCIVLSICSAAGQLFIYYTISQFGAVVFVIIMTVRQGLAILLSCIIYHHYITAVGVIGVFIVFVAIFLRIYCSQRLKNIRKKAKELSNVKV